MARIAFILLCHRDPDGIIAQARRLTASGDMVALHFDGRAPAAEFDRIRAALSDNPSVVFPPRRVKCGWGEWSLVAATLATLRAAEAAFPLATHFYMLSGDCMPTKTAEHARAFLDADDCDYIESVDFFRGNWIKTGFRDERLIYRHWFNERNQRWLFYRSYDLQRRLGLTRRVPPELDMRIGSQWWCLRRRTVESLLDFCDIRPDIMRFFATTWIPDETFFQTVTAHLVPANEIRSRSLTFLLFTDYGMPVTFHNDHYDLLLGQDCLFARKISPEAEELKQRLAELWLQQGVRFRVSNAAPGLFRFLTGQGRHGRRFAPRIWEDGGSLARGQWLFFILSKKWSVAKRLTAAIRARSDIAAVDYLFNEQHAHLPDLGGVENTVSKRQRHRRALVRLLLDQFGKDGLVLCVDPSEIGLLRDLSADKAESRILFIDAPFSDAYLRDHVRRIGLVGPHAPETMVDALLPTMRNTIAHEADMLRDLRSAQFHEIGPDRPPEVNARAIAAFLDVTTETAQSLAEIPNLFED